jgi:hypothetical protein
MQSQPGLATTARRVETAETGVEELSELRDRRRRI